jgi:hypothetical protein
MNTALLNEHVEHTPETMAALITAGNEAQRDYVQNNFKHPSPLDPWVKQAQLEAEVAAEMSGESQGYYESHVAYRGVARELHKTEALAAVLSDASVAPDK